MMREGGEEHKNVHAVLYHGLSWSSIPAPIKAKGELLSRAELLQYLI